MVSAAINAHYTLILKNAQQCTDTYASIADATLAELRVGDGGTVAPNTHGTVTIMSGDVGGLERFPIRCSTERPESRRNLDDPLRIGATCD
jgi:hypothetical protein